MHSHGASMSSGFNRLLETIRTEEQYSRGHSRVLRAEQLLILQKTDRLVALMLTAQLVLWLASELNVHHFNLSKVVFFVSSVAIFSIAAARVRPGELATRHFLVVCQMLVAGFSSQVLPSSVSMPFFLFASMILLAFYLDWTLIISASLIWLSIRAGVLHPFSSGSSLLVFMLEAVSLALFDSILVFACSCRLKVLETVARREVEQQLLIHQAYHDPLTGLGNRLKIDQLLEAADLSSRDRIGDCGILLIDLDYFKEVNDSHGHQIGDEVLKEASRRLQATTRDSDTVIRLGGDEFAVVLQSSVDIKLAAGIAERIVSSVGQPFQCGKLTVVIGASVGICIRDKGFSSSSEELLRHADKALYKAKELGRGTYVIFDQAMQMREAKDISLESRLRIAVSRQLFELYYQPILTTNSELVGFEALLRWDDEIHGQVSPVDFVPLAESTGLIVRLGEWVLSRACREATFWHALGRTEIGVAVNVSGLQLADSGFAKFVSQTLEETGFPAASLTLEITESVLIGYKGQSLETLAELNRLGVQLAIDDFGTGFSCLSYLRHLPVQMVKIDCAFSKDLASSPSARLLIEEVVRLAHVLNLRTVAEGIESDYELSAVSAAGCDAVQGFHFSKAIPAEQALALINSKLPTRPKQFGPQLCLRTGTDS